MTDSAPQETQPGMDANGQPGIVPVASEAVDVQAAKELRRKEHELRMEAQVAKKAAKLAQKLERHQENEIKRQEKVKRKAENSEKNKQREEVARAAKRQKQEEKSKAATVRKEESDGKVREKLSKECEVVVDMTSIADYLRTKHTGAKINIVGTTPSVTIQFDSPEEAKNFLSQSGEISVPVQVKARPALNRFRTLYFELELEGNKAAQQEKLAGLLAADGQLKKFPVAFVEVFSRKFVVVQFDKEEDVAKALAIMTDPAFRFDGQVVKAKVGKPGRAQRRIATEKIGKPASE